MNKKLKMMDKRKIYGSILGGIIFLITILSFTYAFYYWRSSNTIVTFNISDSQFYCETDIDSSVSSLSPVLDYKDGSYQTFKVNNIGGSDTTFSLSMNVSICNNDSNDDCSVFQDESFKYKLMLDPTGGSRDCHADDTNCTLVGGGSFSSIHKGMNTLISSINLPNNSKYQYYFFMYIDGDMQNPVNLQNSSMTSSLGVCDIVVFFEPNGEGASVSPTYKKVIYGNTYGTLPTATRSDAVVSFNSNGGSSASSQTVQFDFEWNRSQDGTGASVSESTLVTDTTNHTLYAKWTPDGSVTLPSVTKNGYDFTGWYSDSALTNRVGGANDTYHPEKSITLYAGWRAQEYTITLKGNEATTVGTTSLKVTYNSSTLDPSTITLPTKVNTVITYDMNGTGLTKPGDQQLYHSFLGWYRNTDDVMVLSNVTTPVLQSSVSNYTDANGKWIYHDDVSLYAKWSSGTNMVTIPEITKTGYTCHWNSSADDSGTSYNGNAHFEISLVQTYSDTDVVSPNSLTLYAICTPNKYTITLDKDLGTDDGTTSIEATYGSSVLNPSTITLPQKKFTVSYDMGSTGITQIDSEIVSAPFRGWYIGNSLVLSNSTTPVLQASVDGYTDASGNWNRTSNATLYALFNDNQVTLPSLEKEGYICKWAESSPNGTEYTAGTTRTISSNTTYYASCTVQSYTVKYQTGNPSCSLNPTTYADNTVNYGTDIHIANPTCTGYTFAGWSASGNIDLITAKYGTSANPSTAWVDGNQGTYFKNLTTTNNGTVTLTALWSVNSYTVTFNPNGGTISEGRILLPSYEYMEDWTYDQSVTEISKVYEEAGWGYAGDEYNQITGTPDKVYKKLSLELSTTYYFSFYASGSTLFDVYVRASSISSNNNVCEVNYNGSAGNKSCIFTTLSNETNYYLVFDFHSRTTNVHIKDFSLKYNDDNGEQVRSVGQSKNVVYGQSYGSLPTPTRVGYTFDGWYTEQNTGSQIITTSVVNRAEDHTLYAHWIADTYTVSYEANKFSTVNQTSGGVTIDYNPDTSVLTLNGTWNSTGINIGTFSDTITTGQSYVMTLTYVSGTITTTTSSIAPRMIFDITKDGSVYSDRTTLPSTFNCDFPASGSNTSTYTVNSNVVGGNGIKFAMYQNTANGTTFSNYQVKVIITKSYDSQSIQYGSNYSLPSETPTRLGYTFTGWYDEEAGGNQVTTSTLMTLPYNHTIYAQWEAKTSYVFYSGTGGMNGETTYEWDAFYNNVNSHSNSVTSWPALRGATTTKGTVNNGTWGADYLQFNGTSSWVNLNFKVTGAQSALFTIEATFMLDEIPSEEKYIVGNIKNGGLGLGVNTGGIPFFMIYSTGTNPYQGAYGPSSLQVGVKYHMVGTYDGTTMRLYLNGTEIATKTVSGSIKETENSVPMALGCNPGPTTCQGGYFKGKIYNVSFWWSAATIYNVWNDSGKTVTYGNTYGTLSGPVRTGYTFGGWYNSTALSTPVTSDTYVMATADHSIYAKWNPNTYTIAYDLDGGSYGTNHPTSGTYDSVVTINNPTKTGYNFAGWTATGLDTAYALRGNSSGDVTTSWNGTDKVKNVYFKNLTVTSGATVTLKANWTRNFTCADVGQTTKYADLDWYTISKSSGVCELALNAQTTTTGAYANAGTAFTSEYYNKNSKLKAEKDAGFITTWDANSGTGSGYTSGTFWTASGKVYHAAAYRTGINCTNTTFYSGIGNTSDGTVISGTSYCTSASLTGGSNAGTIMDLTATSTSYTPKKLVTNTTTYYQSANYRWWTGGEGSTSSIAMVHHSPSSTTGSIITASTSITMYGCGASSSYDYQGKKSVVLKPYTTDKFSFRNVVSSITGNYSYTSSRTISFAGVSGSNTGTAAARIYRYDQTSDCAKKTYYTLGNDTAVSIHYRLHIKVKTT